MVAVLGIKIIKIKTELVQHEADFEATTASIARYFKHRIENAKFVPCILS